MKNYFIVVAHPEPKSFNQSMVREGSEHLRQLGHKVEISDLWAMGWQPVSDRRNFKNVSNPDYYKQQFEEAYAAKHDGFAPDIAAEIEKLFWCDVLVLQFPLWWFGMPAILKGWVDKVFAYEKIYSREKWYETGSFKGKKALVSLSTGSPERLFGKDGVHPDISALLLPIHHGIFRFNGFTPLEPFLAWEVAHVTDKARQDYIESFKLRLERC